jgi:hypothetical protein
MWGSTSVNKNPMNLAAALRGKNPSEKTHLERYPPDVLARGKEETYLKLQRHPLNTMLAFLVSGQFIG